MDFYMHHGRTDPDGPPQLLDSNGTPFDVDDWGFEGPHLTGCIGFHATYGVQGHWNLYFENSDAANRAEALTGWQRWDDNCLTVDFSTDNSCVRIRDAQFNRDHFFGDWGLK